MKFYFSFEELSNIMEGKIVCNKFETSKFVNQIEIYPFLIEEGDAFISLNSSKYSNSNGSIGFSGDEDSVFGLGGFNDITEDIWEAIKRGAKLIITDNSEICKIIKNRITVIIVADSLNALVKLSARLISESKIRTIGITGSTGKTTLTQAIYDFLNLSYNVSRIDSVRTSVLSIAYHIIKNVTNEDDFLIVEMQCDYPEQISSFTEIIKLDFAFITNINYSHLKRFKSIENIIKEKTSIYYGLKKNGYLFININSEILSNWYTENNNYNIITIGFNDIADYYSSNVKLCKNYNSVSFYINNTKSNSKIFVESPIPGNQYIEVFMFVFALSQKLSFSEKAFLRNINNCSSVVARFQIFNGINNSTVIIDSYNASRLSMENSISYACSINKKKHILILGSMLELAECTKEEHEKLGRFINKLSNVDYLLSIGEAMLYLNKEITSLKKGHIYHCFSYEKMLTFIDNLEIDNDTVILVKGSGSMRMELIGMNLLKGKCF